MNQTLLVGMVQGLGHRCHYFNRFVQRQTGPLGFVARSVPSMYFETTETGEVRGAADIEHGNDVRVIEVGDGTGFSQVGFGIFVGGHSMPVRHFDGHKPL